MKTYLLVLLSALSINAFAESTTKPSPGQIVHVSNLKQEFPLLDNSKEAEPKKQAVAQAISYFSFEKIKYPNDPSIPLVTGNTSKVEATYMVRAPSEPNQEQMETIKDLFEQGIPQSICSSLQLTSVLELGIPVEGIATFNGKEAYRKVLSKTDCPKANSGK